MVDGFDKVYAEYFSEVYKFVISLCQNPVLAEEITQETFSKLLKISIILKVSVKLVHGCAKLQKIHFIVMQKSIMEKLIFLLN